LRGDYARDRALGVPVRRGEGLPGFKDHRAGPRCQHQRESGSQGASATWFRRAECSGLVQLSPRSARASRFRCQRLLHQCAARVHRHQPADVSRALPARSSGRNRCALSNASAESTSWKPGVPARSRWASFRRNRPDTLQRAGNLRCRTTPGRPSRRHHPSWNELGAELSPCPEPSQAAACVLPRQGVPAVFPWRYRREPHLPARGVGVLQTHELLAVPST